MSKSRKMFKGLIRKLLKIKLKGKKGKFKAVTLVPKGFFRGYQLDKRKHVYRGDKYFARRVKKSGFRFRHKKLYYKVRNKRCKYGLM